MLLVRHHSAPTEPSTETSAAEAQLSSPLAIDGNAHHLDYDLQPLTVEGLSHYIEPPADNARFRVH